MGAIESRNILQQGYSIRQLAHIIVSMDTMHTISTHARVAATGHLHLDVATQLPAGEVDIVLVLVPRIPASVLTKPGFADLAGRLTWRGDAVAEQRRLRDEW